MSARSPYTHTGNLGLLTFQHDGNNSNGRAMGVVMMLMLPITVRVVIKVNMLALGIGTIVTIETLPTVVQEDMCILIWRVQFWQSQGSPILALG